MGCITVLLGLGGDADIALVSFLDDVRVLLVLWWLLAQFAAAGGVCRTLRFAWSGVCQHSPGCAGDSLDDQSLYFMDGSAGTPETGRGWF